MGNLGGQARPPRRVQLEEGPDGLRARQHGSTADAEFWGDLWSQQEVDYSAAEAGHLPHKLRSTFVARVPAPATVLEAGCGLGHFTVAAAALGYKATGLDWSDRTVAQLNERFPALDFRVGDVRALELDDGTFDAVYSPGVCEHFEEGPDQIMRETLRVLRPGGIAFVSTPHLNALRARRWRGRRVDRDREDFYQYLFTRDGMSRTLARVGFDVLGAHVYGTWSSVVGEWPVLGRLPAGRAVGVLDLVPGIRQLGSSCIWIGRKPAAPG